MSAVLALRQNLCSSLVPGSEGTRLQWSQLRPGTLSYLNPGGQCPPFFFGNSIKWDLQNSSLNAFPVVTCWEGNGLIHGAEWSPRTQSFHAVSEQGGLDNRAQELSLLWGCAQLLLSHGATPTVFIQQLLCSRCLSDSGMAAMNTTAEIPHSSHCIPHHEPSVLLP
jgi:hypothetical protein